MNRIDPPTPRPPTEAETGLPRLPRLTPDFDRPSQKP